MLITYTSFNLQIFADVELGEGISACTKVTRSPLKMEVSEEQCKHGTICHAIEIENRKCVPWNSNDDIEGVEIGDY
jgi:hypothetical protein